MGWTIDYNDDMDLVLLTYFGKVNGAEIQKAAAARIDMGKKKGVTRFLIDTRKVEADSSATTKIYEIPTKLYVKKKFERSSRIAILAPESPISKKMVRFFEDVCMNRGWLAMMFQDRNRAVKWLQQSSPQQSPACDA